MKNDKKFEPVLPALSEDEKEKVSKVKQDLEVCIEGLRSVAADLVKLVSNENVDKLDALWLFNEWVYKRKLSYFDGDIEKMDSIIEELNYDFFDIISMIETREDYLRTEGVPVHGSGVKCCFVHKDELNDLEVCPKCGSLLSFAVWKCPVCHL